MSSDCYHGGTGKADAQWNEYSNLLGSFANLFNPASPYGIAMNTFANFAEFMSHGFEHTVHTGYSEDVFIRSCVGMIVGAGAGALFMAALPGGGFAIASAFLASYASSKVSETATNIYDKYFWDCHVPTQSQ